MYLKIETLDGEPVYGLTSAQCVQSSFINNMIIDLNLCDDEVIPLNNIFISCTSDEVNRFMTIWAKYYDIIPANLEKASVNYVINLPVELELMIMPGNNYDDYLKSCDIKYDNCQIIYKWDIRLLTMFINASNFLDLSKMINLFKLLISKQYSQLLKLNCKN